MIFALIARKVVVLSAGCLMMKRFYMTLMLAASLVLAGCSDKNDGEKFVVGFDAEFPPYGFVDEDGEYTGFDLDLAEEVAERNGWELVKQPID